jgi:5-methylcytosine-specific restriction endonuclease McrA
MTTTKPCVKCDSPKPLEDFHKNSRAKDGRKSTCKACVASNSEEKAQNRERRMRYYEANKELERAKQKVYWAETKVIRCEQQRAYWAKTREARNAQQQKQYSNDPQQYKARAKSRRGVERGAEGSFTAEDMWAIYMDCRASCAYCGIHLTYAEVEWDHIVPLDKQGSNWPSNITCSCQHCNRSKWNRLLAEWPNRPWDMKKGPA